MEAQILVVSDPPHREVDYGAAAAILGLGEEDTRLKIGFPAPEVLLAWDPDGATQFAQSLRTAGLNLEVIDGNELAALPWPVPVTSFGFGGKGLVASTGDAAVEISYDTPTVGVFCHPPSGFPPQGPAGVVSGDLNGDGSAVSEAMEWMSRLDIYFVEGADLRRISIARDVTDFSGLAGLQSESAAQNVVATVDECARRFTRLTLDDRLTNVRPRQRFEGGEVPFDLDMRKLYSFGTLLLRSVLESISPELRDVTQYELGSRLAYVLSGRGNG